LLGLLPSLSDARLRQGYLNYLKWTEPLALMLELVEGEEQAVQVVRLALEVDLRLGARLAGAVRYGFQERTVGLLMREIEERGIPQVSAIALLGETRSDVVIERLTKDKYWDLHSRSNVIEILVKIGGDKAIKSLIQALKNENSHVRSLAVKALGIIGNKKAIEPLIQDFFNNEDSYRRWDAVESLGKISSEMAFELLMQFLNNEDPKTRSEAVRTIGNIGGNAGIEPLIQALKDKNISVRCSAKDALGKIGNDRAVEPLIQALKDDGYDYIRTASDALIMIGSEKTVEILIQTLKDDKVSYVRMEAAYILGVIGNDRAVEPLIQALKDDDVHTQICAASQLSRFSNKKAIEAFSEFAKNRFHSEARNAVDSLRAVENSADVDELVNNLKDKHSDKRRNALESLVIIDCKKAVETLIQILEDENELIHIREMAAEALENIGSNKSVEPPIQVLTVETLIQILENENELIYLREMAAEALGKIANVRAIEPLIQSLKDGYDAYEDDEFSDVYNYENKFRDKYDVMRSKAAEALGMLCNDKAVDSLIHSLDDRNEAVRWKAAKALGKIANVRTVDPLIQTMASYDEDHIVYLMAKEALENIIETDRNLPTLTQQLPHLLTLIPTQSSQPALSVITAIQARCKYYNYAIYNTALQETENCANPVEKILQEIHQTLKTMSETGKYDIKAEVVQIVEKNYGQVIGKNSGQAIGKNYANDPALLQTINEITQVLANLQKAHPTATEAEAKDIIEAEFKEIQNNQPNRWSTFRQQLLNPERWLNGGKATISEIAKHYAENSVFLKAGVAFLDGFSADEE